MPRSVKNPLKVSTNISKPQQCAQSVDQYLFEEPDSALFITIKFKIAINKLQETLIVEKADVIIDEPFACTGNNRSMALNHSLCVKGRFSEDPGAILVCDGDVSGVFIRSMNTTDEFNLFTDISYFNDWIDSKFKAALNQELPEELAKADLVTEKPKIKVNDPFLRK